MWAQQASALCFRYLATLHRAGKPSVVWVLSSGQLQVYCTWLSFNASHILPLRFALVELDLKNEILKNEIKIGSGEIATEFQDRWII